MRYKRKYKKGIVSNIAVLLIFFLIVTQGCFSNNTTEKEAPQESTVYDDNPNLSDDNATEKEPLQESTVYDDNPNLLLTQSLNPFTGYLQVQKLDVGSRIFPDEERVLVTKLKDNLVEAECTIKYDPEMVQILYVSEGYVYGDWDFDIEFNYQNDDINGLLYINIKKTGDNIQSKKEEHLATVWLCGKGGSGETVIEFASSKLVAINGSLIEHNAVSAVFEVFSDPEFIEIPGTITAVEGEPFTYQVSAYDPDGNNLEYYLIGISETPPGMVIDEVTGLITWEQPVKGTYHLTVGVSEIETGGLGSAIMEFKLIVN